MPGYDAIKEIVWGTISKQYPVTRETFDRAWGTVEQSGVIDQLIAQRKAEDLSKFTLEQLEKMIGDDLKKNNKIALEMIKRPNFNRELVMETFNGLGVEIEMGAEGGYGKGIQLKRKLNLQQFYTSAEVSKLVAKVLHIPEMARIFDPTCGTGRLFWGMPNPRMLHGIEIEADAYNIAKALFPTAQIIQDDTMLHIHEGVMDYVIANPPFTLYWPDKNRLFQHAGYNNKIVSEMAVFESAVRSLKPQGGVVVIVMPSDVWPSKFIDKRDFVDWLKGKVTPLAKIELPIHTHEGTVWPTALYFFYTHPDYQTHWKERTPDYPLYAQLKSFEGSEIEALVAKFKRLGDDYAALMNIADNIGNQVPFKLEIVPIKVFDIADYLKSAEKITTDDVIELDAQIPDIGTFEAEPITFTPNGLHAALKVNGLRSRSPPIYSPSRQAYVDVFREQMARLDAFLDEKTQYDELPLVRGLHLYDCAIKHSELFTKALGKRKEWMDFQNTPFEIYVDERQDGHWKELYGDQGYKAKYPAIYNQWKAKFNAMMQDPQYTAYIKHLNIKDNWLKHLFEFQKEDVLRLGLKASTIITSQMGLGKTRVCIAAALLKGFRKNLIVVPTRLIETWVTEFSDPTDGVGLPEPLVIKYDDDLNQFLTGDDKFAIISLETLKDATHTRPRPRTAHKIRRNPNVPLSNYDVPSVFDWQQDMIDMLISEGFNYEEAEGVMMAPMLYTGSENPTKEQAEEKETKEMEKLKKLQTAPMYSDKFINQIDLMIVDEAHNLQNPTTMQSECVRRIHARQNIFMTGTPIKNRVRGLLSLVVIGWGEETLANPYNKRTFLEHFTQFKNISVEYADAHGFVKTKDQEIEIPAIANPDDLRALMNAKWLRRTMYEPAVAADRKFPKPAVKWIPIKASAAERTYAKQWYDEYQRIKHEIQAAKEELKALKDRRQFLSGEQLASLDKIAAELKTKIAIAGIVIGKLRAVAIAPQIEWLTIHTKQHGEEGEEFDEDKLPPLQRLIKIPNKYRGGLTPRQEEIIEQISKHVKAKEQVYTIVSFPEYNHILLGPELVKRGMRVDYIDGGVSTDRRNAILDRFRKKEIDVLLATIGTFDIGINIPDASYCAIINPEWNWSDMSQAYSRMIRPQSKGERTVDIFYCAESIEKYVKQLSEMKKYNAEYVIDYGPRPPNIEDIKWERWSDAVNQMFVDMVKGDFNV